jgi:hypothetical protein
LYSCAPRSAHAWFLDAMLGKYVEEQDFIWCWLLCCYYWLIPSGFTVVLVRKIFQNRKLQLNYCTKNTGLYVVWYTVLLENRRVISS